MCNDYINLQTNEKLDLQKLEILDENTMLKVKPELFSLWNFEENDKLKIDIYKVTKGISKKAWWICPDCNGTYPQRIDSKTKGYGCSICTGKYVTKENCLVTTRPDVASLLLNLDDGYKYTKMSDSRLDWKCPDCDNIIINKRIKDISRNGLTCPLCSDGTKYPEKVMCNILKSLNIDFSHDIKMEFCESKRYDFYLPQYNMIIETHGGQHYEDGFDTMGGRSAKEEQENDRYKLQIAKENSIENYIVIDCRRSEINWIKNNILESKLVEFFDFVDLDWDKIDEDSQNSNKIDCLNMYLDGCRDYKYIAETLKVDYATIMRWLKFWGNIGKCDYIPLDTRKEIVQLDMSYNFIKSWDSVADARQHYKNVSKVLNKGRSNDQGARFMYKDEYDNYLIDNDSYTFRENKEISKKVVQLTVDEEIITVWNSIKEASDSVGLKSSSSISGVCKGNKKTAKKYKWMYLEDYEIKYGEIEE